MYTCVWGVGGYVGVRVRTPGLGLKQLDSSSICPAFMRSSIYEVSIKPMRFDVSGCSAISSLPSAAD